MQGFMKKHIVWFGVVVLIALIALTSCSDGKAKTINAGGVLTVNDIQSDPLAYKGTITITGVVAGVTRDPKVFTLVDTAEAIACKTTGCARFYLPVRYEGAIPTQWDEVNVTGSFTQAERFPIFAATKVDVLRNYFKR